MSLKLFILYLTSAIGLSLTPGPNSLLVLAHGARLGHVRTLATILGGTLGFVLLIAASMLGIGTLLQTSPYALWVLKVVGGLYLITLGWQLWQAPPPDFELQKPQISATPLPSENFSSLFQQGFWTALSNPKALLFYGALLPQFTDDRAPLLPQFVTMALTFAIVEFVVEWVLAALAQRLRTWLTRHGRTFNRVCAVMFMLIGIALPLSGWF